MQRKTNTIKTYHHLKRNEIMQLKTKEKNMNGKYSKLSNTIDQKL